MKTARQEYDYHYRTLRLNLMWRLQNAADDPRDPIRQAAARALMARDYPTTGVLMSDAYEDVGGWSERNLLLALQGKREVEDTEDEPGNLTQWQKDYLVLYTLHTRQPAFESPSEVAFTMSNVVDAYRQNRLLRTLAEAVGDVAHDQARDMEYRERVGEYAYRGVSQSDFI